MRALTARFDGCELDDLRVGPEAFAAANAQLSDQLRAAILAAKDRIERFHVAGMMRPYVLETAPGVACERVMRPIQRVGLYVPAGSAPLPSTALMLGVPAQLARCPEVVLCTPPRADGTADPAVLVAAQACGIERVFLLGGVQAIAAMAYGVGMCPLRQTVRAGQQLYHPGQAAGRQRSAGAAIDAGRPFGSADHCRCRRTGIRRRRLLAGRTRPGLWAIAISDGAALLEQVAAQIAEQAAVLPRQASWIALARARLIQWTTSARPSRSQRLCARTSDPVPARATPLA